MSLICQSAMHKQREKNPNFGRKLYRIHGTRNIAANKMKIISKTKNMKSYQMKELEWELPFFIDFIIKIKNPFLTSNLISSTAKF